MLSYDVILKESFPSARGDDLALLDDIATIGDAACELQILFDQQHGETLLFSYPIQDLTDLVDDAGLNSV
jgi:hypothetical protein